MVHRFIALLLPLVIMAPLADLGAGLRTIARDPLIRLLTFAAVVGNFVGTPLFAVVLPVMTTNAMLPATVLGMLLAAFAGGLVTGSLTLGRLPPRVRRSRVLVAGFASAGLALVVGALGDSIPWLAAWLFVAGTVCRLLEQVINTVAIRCKDHALTVRRPQWRPLISRMKCETCWYTGSKIQEPHIKLVC